MPQGENLTRGHQTRVGSRPRPGKIGAKGVAKTEIEEQARINGESLDEATLRLQVARADTEELDRQKRQLELDKAKGLLVTKDEAVDLAQQAVLRVVAILDLLPERLRDRLDPEHYEACDILDDIIRQARSDVADGR